VDELLLGLGARAAWDDAHVLLAIAQDHIHPVPDRDLELWFLLHGLIFPAAIWWVMMTSAARIPAAPQNAMALIDASA
jgi:hypothetical protein